MSRPIKNPEKYIVHLKKEIEWLKESKNQLQIQRNKKEGIQIVTWTSHEGSQTESGLDLLNFKPGDKVAIIGEVFHVEGSKYKEGNMRSEIKYMILETRKIE